MVPIDVFPDHLSTTVVPVMLPDKPDALEYAARGHHLPRAKRVFVLFCKELASKKTSWHHLPTNFDPTT
ncbi:hypothetical protein TNCV_4313951 [Trichonephila clavipes]|nr:hypothetical protein TNCV_4313951 [Trichonephila clavipes]